MYYKEIIFMDNSRMRITPDQFQALKIAQSRQDKHMIINGDMIAISSISRTEDTGEPLPKPLTLPGTTDPDHKHVRTPTERGLKALLVKKMYPRKVWDSKMSQMPGYTLLEADAQTVWAAFTHVPCDECGITIDAIECEPEEYAKCGWKRETANVSQA